MRKFFVIGIILSWFIFSTIIWAGTTGKIAGFVRDAETGEPLIGANILVSGTYLGAATDQDGYFYIINVPAGEYYLEVSMIGYRTLVHGGVQVLIDQTTKVEFELQSEAI
nr:carboxypeptidase-like regulatory domain-containing protein [Fodinibius sp.]NIV11621.1 TonB-dependent receptor [Fodinibius sp.]NIY25232.1 TonB-dependent receptor [Fodinibius sp.]